MTRPQPRVLIVDDHPEMARTTADGLAEHGYDTVVAVGGQEAIDRLSSESIDAVITDLRMPGIDGLAVLAASRRVDPQRPVIVMTAYSAIDSAMESIRQGAYHYLTKPFSMKELTCRVAALTRRARRASGRLSLCTVAMRTRGCRADDTGARVTGAARPKGLRSPTDCAVGLPIEPLLRERK